MTAEGPDRAPEGESRVGSDWMDFDEEDGGPTRKMVHLGGHDLRSRRGEGESLDLEQETGPTGRDAQG